MAAYHLISDLHDDKTDWSIRVKVLKKWFQKSGTTGDSLQFMLIDEEGETIQAYLYMDDLFKRYDRKIHEGAWIRFSEFVVFQDTEPEPNCPIGWSIRFCLNTIVDKINPMTIQDSRGLYSFSDVFGGKTDAGFPIDILGYVVTIDQLQTVNDDSYPLRQDKKTASMTFTIKDHKGLLLPCSATGQLALEFNDKIDSDNQLPILCLLTDWSVIDGEGGTYLKSRGGISRIEFHPDIPQAKTFRRRFWNKEKTPQNVIDLGTNDDEASSSSKKNT